MSGDHPNDIQPAAAFPLPKASRVVVAALFLVIGFVSLLLSYKFYTSDAWIKRFTEDGWWVEFGRLVLGLGVALFLLSTVFRAEADELLSPRAKPSVSRSIRFSRLGIALALLAALAALVLHHTWLGPAELYEKINGAAAVGTPWLSDAEARAIYLTPYLWYMPYAIVTMIAILFIVTAVSCVGSARDVLHVDRRCESADACMVDESKELAECRGMLHSAAQQLRDHIRRASWLVASVLALILYERYWGWDTLSDTGRKFATAAYILMLLSASFLAISHVRYGDSYSKASMRLGDGADEALKGLSPTAVWLKARATSPIVFFVLAVIAAFVKDWVKPGGGS